MDQGSRSSWPPVEAADRANGPQRARNAALLRVLLHNALRVDELLGADIADLGRHPGREHVHATLTIRRKGGRRARIALAPATVEAFSTTCEIAKAAMTMAPAG